MGWRCGLNKHTHVTGLLNWRAPQIIMALYSHHHSFTGYLACARSIQYTSARHGVCTDDPHGGRRGNCPPLHWPWAPGVGGCISAGGSLAVPSLTHTPSGTLRSHPALSSGGGTAGRPSNIHLTILYSMLGTELRAGLSALGEFTV